MRKIATLNLRVGLFNIPMGVNSFLDYQDISFKQLCPSCKSPINYKKFCGNCKVDVPHEKLLSGFQVGKNNILEVDKGVFETIDRETRVVAVIPTNSEQEFLGTKYYILSPISDVEKPYFLLKSILSKLDKELVILYALRQKLNLGVIKSVNIKGKEFLMLKQILYAERIKSIEEIAEKPIAEEELNLGMELFNKLVENLQKINYMEIKDERKKLIEKYIMGEIKPIPIERVKEVKSLVDELKASVDLMKEKPKKKEVA
jgi:DNA end-binding protein Ku